MKKKITDWLDFDELDGMTVDEVCAYLKSKKEWEGARLTYASGYEGYSVAFEYEREETSEEKQARLKLNRDKRHQAKLMDEKMDLIRKLEREKFMNGKFEELGFFKPIFRDR